VRNLQPPARMNRFATFEFADSAADLIVVGSSSDLSHSSAF